jgi:fructose-1,6-bisphosphatase I
VKIAALSRQNGLGEQLGAVLGGENADGDEQKALDVAADEHIENALRTASVAAYLSEEREGAVMLSDKGSLLVACDPLDGSSNIDTNLTVGTIFSLLPFDGSTLLMSGDMQIASGFFAYGPQTTLLLTIGQGVEAFCLDDSGDYRRMDWQVAIPRTASEFAINASNSRHWQAEISDYISDLLAGKTGPRGKNFNMRWAGSLVADAFRIFRRGGIFLYPSDQRDNYEKGRLRLVYEAHPIAFLVEQAGGLAYDGQVRILEITPDELHQRVPLIFGSSDEVDLICKGA